MAHSHDTGYKFLFSHAELVRELLEVFAPPGVSELLEYDTLQRENASFVTPAMKQREDDVVWSVKLSGQRIYLYLLLEFQSRIDRAMPVRMLQYVAALYDHLLRSKAIKLKDGLPPVLPIVLYNGDKRWLHSPEVFDLVQPHPAVLSAFQPRLKFWLLDEGQFSPEYLFGLQRVMAALFLVERASGDMETVKQAIRHFGQTVANSPRKALIDQALIEWLRHRSGHTLPQVPDLAQTDNLLEITNMLETNIKRLIKRAAAEAAAEAAAQAMAEGRLEGKLEGKLEGEAALLERLIARRFGPITPSTRLRLDSATAAQLEAWADRILDARTLAEVFVDH
ncbi:MAG: hypothetical protein JM57_13280 [Comamonadaceae bacterium BICA1-1]|nr:MAG: hypothetical protein JM57_13280 [Comamonadaceae bacterium BICA1-1]